MCKLEVEKKKNVFHLRLITIEQNFVGIFAFHAWDDIDNLVFSRESFLEKIIELLPFLCITLAMLPIGERRECGDDNMHVSTFAIFHQIFVIRAHIGKVTSVQNIHRAQIYDNFHVIGIRQAFNTFGCIVYRLTRYAETAFMDSLP